MSDKPPVTPATGQESRRQQDLFADSQESPWEDDDVQMNWVAEVVFADPPFGPFDYLVPDTIGDKLKVGCRVRVPLGRGNRRLEGYCVGLLYREVRSADRLKPIDRQIDKAPLVPESLVELARWMGSEYLCPWGSALGSIVPAGVRQNAGLRETTFLLLTNSAAELEAANRLTEKQKAVIQVLENSPVALTPPQTAEAAGCTIAVISRLRKAGLIRAEVRRVQVFAPGQRVIERQLPHVLNSDQQQALNAIRKAVKTGVHETFLLRGVTGSGKTEVYIQSIDEVIHHGKQAIVLVPEISLTPQTRQRFESRFDQVAVLHSRLSDSERHWYWREIGAGRVNVVVGARSAVFAPLPRLGLIVIDEEHDSSFKQDQSPRYHAVSVALRRGTTAQAPVILGSATPSLETWHAAQSGEFRHLPLPTRVMERPMPNVRAIDLRYEEDLRGALSRPLIAAAEQALNDKGQVILLLNRRGFSTYIQCWACGHHLKCHDCDIALIHHRDRNLVKCHYCDYEAPCPAQCPQCDSQSVQYGGRGTQRLEDEVRRWFRGARVFRMDSDTMKKVENYEEALDRFRSGQIDILLGTQMIAKGLDFPNVTLVGVVDADTGLHLADFRAAERSFQLVTQVAGRTGRGDKGGHVLVQTRSPEHPALELALEHDFQAFAEWELKQRRMFGYPPFTRIIRVILRGEHDELTQQCAEQFARQVVDQAPQLTVRGPAPAPIARIRGLFRWHLLISAPRSLPPQPLIAPLLDLLPAPGDRVQWAIDVDPTSLL